MVENDEDGASASNVPTYAEVSAFVKEVIFVQII